MSKIALIACTKSKALEASPAALLYRSPLFRKSLLYALSIADRVYILSAKHGVLPLDEIVEPYELSIKNLDSLQKACWVSKVGDRLGKLIEAKDQVHILAGLEYTRPLLPVLHKIGCQIIFPLGSKSLGHRIGWLRTSNLESDLFSQFASFYTSMRELYIGQGGKASERKGKAKYLLMTITDGRKHPIEKGHLIYLEGGSDEIQQRGTYKHKHWAVPEIEKLVESIEDVYGGVEKTVICTRGRTVTQVARELAKVMFLCDYQETDIEDQLIHFSEGVR
jgi:hypothetical protein